MPDLRDLVSPLLQNPLPATPVAELRRRAQRRMRRRRALLGLGAACALLAAGVAVGEVDPETRTEVFASRTTTTLTPERGIEHSPTAGVTAAPTTVAAEACPSMPRMELFSSSSGWLLTERGLFLTTDGGKRWRDISPLAPATLSLVRFIDADHGWVVAKRDTATLYRTVDGGRSWQELRLPSAGGNEVGLEFIDADQGWAWVSFRHDTGRHIQWTLSRTTDGGESWELLANPSPVDPGAEFVTALQGWGASAADEVVNRLLRTSDGGRTWREHSPQPPAQDPESGTSGIGVTWFDGRDGIVTAHSRAQPTFFVTIDGGRTWERREPPGVGPPIATGPPLTFAPVDIRRWRLAYLGEAYASEDGGQSWRAVGELGKDRYVERLSFATPAMGWAVVEVLGASGSCRPRWEVLATQNGGATWRALLLPTSGR